jgi:hypothetical protein
MAGMWMAWWYIIVGALGALILPLLIIYLLINTQEVAANN